MCINAYSVLVGMSSNELEEWKTAYMQDKLYSKILKVSQADNDEEGNYFQYQIRNGLIYFEDWNGNFRLCVPRFSPGNGNKRSPQHFNRISSRRTR